MALGILSPIIEPYTSVGYILFAIYFILSAIGIVIGFAVYGIAILKRMSKSAQYMKSNKHMRRLKIMIYSSIPLMAAFACISIALFVSGLFLYHVMYMYVSWAWDLWLWFMISSLFVSRSSSRSILTSSFALLTFHPIETELWAVHRDFTLLLAIEVVSIETLMYINPSLNDLGGSQRHQNSTAVSMGKTHVALP